MSIACPNCQCDRCEAIRTIEALGGVVDISHEWRTLAELADVINAGHGSIKEGRMSQAEYNHLWDRVAPAERSIDEQGAYIEFSGAKVRVRN